MDLMIAPSQFSTSLKTDTYFIHKAKKKKHTKNRWIELMKDKIVFYFLGSILFYGSSAGK